MLSGTASLHPVFLQKSSSAPKQVDCIRVDGVTDKRPCHETIQYWWTVWHITQSKTATLVTTRSSGSLFLNCVELQNGCQHANTFIPSTPGGSCLNPDTGSIDQHKLKQSLDLAITAYISRVDGCPCGETTIKLFRGSDSHTCMHAMPRYTKESRCTFERLKKEKKVLEQAQPELYANFQNVYNVRNRHIMVMGLPSSYIFLRCYFIPCCIHPLCQRGPQHAVSTWYPGGPSPSGGFRGGVMGVS